MITDTEGLETARREAVFVAGRPWGQSQHGECDAMCQVLDVPLDVQVGEKQWTAQGGEVICTPAGSLHRLGSSGTRTGRILEIAFGSFDEADIERVHDDCARLDADSRRPPSSRQRPIHAPVASVLHDRRVEVVHLRLLATHRGCLSGGGGRGSRGADGCAGRFSGWGSAPAPLRTR